MRTLCNAALLGVVLLSGALAAHASDPVYIFREAEDFKPVTGDWEAKPWGTNYYAASMSNTFLSRKAFLGAPEQGVAATAVADVVIPAADTYLVLCRYEACYRFETQFGIRIEQGGNIVFDCKYGARANPKIWAFSAGKELEADKRFGWGPVENIVWEGRDDKVPLQAGPARITLYKDRQPEPAARRNVDIVLLTNNEEDVKNRLAKEGQLPLDGLLTQQGDLFVKVTNCLDAGAPILFSASADVGSEHSPYWVHMRAWKTKLIGAKGEGADPKNDSDWLLPGNESPWVEVGSLIDSLNDYGWRPGIQMKGDDAAKPHYVLSLASPDKDGKPEIIRTLDTKEKSVFLAVPGNIRAAREIVTGEELGDRLAKAIAALPAKGKRPQQILFYPPLSTLAERYCSSIWKALGMNTGDNKNSQGEDVPETTVDIRGMPPEKMRAWCDEQKAKGLANLIRIVSLGDEIGLEGATGADVDERFRQFVQKESIAPADVVPGAGGWEQVRFDVKDRAKARQYYYSHVFNGAEGRRVLKECSDILRRNLPNALIGANYSPHPFYWPRVNQWVDVFRDEAMTMPWSEDYLWQIPLTSQQIWGFVLDACRCAAKYHDQRVYMYAMPHTPGNTPASFRRAFYEDVAHGATIFDFFSPLPTVLSYTENNVREKDINMWKAMRDVVVEAGVFEDIVYPGKVRPAQAAILLSASSEIWNDSPLFNAEKQHIWMALRNAQYQVDLLTEHDLIAGYLQKYGVLYVCDPCVRKDASKALVDWVNQGGRVFATAGAALRNEFNEPNEALRALFAIEPDQLTLQDIPFQGKADLPWLEPLDRVVWRDTALPVLTAQQRFHLLKPREEYADPVLNFESGSCAVAARKTGQGTALYAGFFPGMAFVQMAVPKRPCDRGATDDAFSHFIPTTFNVRAQDLIVSPMREANIEQPVFCSDPHVETSWIEAPKGIAVTLINWSGKPIQDLSVRVRGAGAIGKVETASGQSATWKKDGEDFLIDLPLDVADLLLLRR